MTTDSDESEATTLAPDDAFAVLGNETRMDILQTLGEADEPLSFSELRDRVGMRDSGQFNYHLDKLVGHFLEDTETGYALRRSGERVIEAVLSGAVTDAPILDRTRIDQSCHYCGAPVEVSYRQEQVGMFCTECEGTYGGTSAAGKGDVPARQERIGYLMLPPAGVHDRTPTEVVQAGAVWSTSVLLRVANSVCPRCSADLEQSVSACEAHDATDGRCDQCDRRHAIHFHARCTNCIFADEAAFLVRFLGNPTLLAFLADHGIDPLSPERLSLPYEEEVLSTKPFEGRYTFTVNDDTLTFLVDDDLTVREVTEKQTSDTG